MKLFMLSLLLSLGVCVGCSKGGPPVHPNAVSNIDSWAYDVLTVEQDAINSAREDFKAGKLPPSAKEPLNHAIDQYNVAQAAWHSYHAGLTTDSTALQNSINALIGAFGEVQKLLGKTPETLTTMIKHWQQYPVKWNAPVNANSLTLAEVLA